MGNHTRSTTQDPSVSIAVQIDGRWDALALSEALSAYHSFLVHHEGHRWIVHARAPGCHEESLEDALRTVEHWRMEHGSSDTPCWIGGEPYELGALGRM